jgi:F0F1-type ATP synthase gamma subunit
MNSNKNVKNMMGSRKFKNIITSEPQAKKINPLTPDQQAEQDALYKLVLDLQADADAEDARVKAEAVRVQADPVIRANRRSMREAWARAMRN